MDEEEDLYNDAVRIVRHKRWMSYMALSRLLQVDQLTGLCLFRRMAEEKIIDFSSNTCRCNIAREDPEAVYLGPPRSLGFAVIPEDLYWDAVRIVSTRSGKWNSDSLFEWSGLHIHKEMAEPLLLRMERENIVTALSGECFQYITPAAGQQNQMTQEESELRSQLSALRVTYSELPALPSTTIEYEGWFQEVRSRIRLRLKYHTLDEQNKLLTLVRLFHEEFKQICAIRFDINRMKGEDQIKQLQIQKQITELQAQILLAKRDLSAAVKPHEASEIEKLIQKTELIKAETACAEAEAKLAQAKANLANIQVLQSQPAPTAQQPEENDPITKVLREFLKQQLAREQSRRNADELYDRLMSLAEELGRNFGDSERRIRDAKKMFEAAGLHRSPRAEANDPPEPTTANAKPEPPSSNTNSNTSGMVSPSNDQRRPRGSKVRRSQP